MAKERSRGNPSIVLLDAVDGIHKIHRAHSDRPQTRDEIAGVFRYTNASSGPAVRKLAALRHFGLLDKHGTRFVVSILARKIIAAEDSPDDATPWLREAFFSVPVFRELLEKHRGSGRSQFSSTIEQELVELGIAENASEEVAAILMESARQASIISEQGELLIWQESDTSTRELRVQVPVSRGRLAEMAIPWPICIEDIETLRGQLSIWQRHLDHRRSTGALPFPAREKGAGV